MSRWSRIAVAILIAVAVLLAAGWLDGTALRDAQRRAGTVFDLSQLADLLSLGSIVVGGAGLLLGVVGWRSRSAVVGAAYAIIGAFFAFLPDILWRYSAGIDDNPPLLPRPIADAVSQIYSWSVGPLNAVGAIGGAMLVVGIAVAGRSFFSRSGDRASEPASGSEPEPIQP